MNSELVITELGGLCPVQGEGTIGGREFYFRARHQSWSFAVAGDGGNALDTYAGIDRPGSWYKRDDWGDHEFAAGYMPVEDAERIIRECAAEYIELQHDLRDAKARAGEETVTLEELRGEVDAG